MGPVPRSPRSLQIVLRTTGQLNASGGGVIAGTMKNDPSSAAEWASCSSLYDSYRVAKMFFESIPNMTFVNSNTYPPLFTVFDPDTTSNLTSPADTLGYDNMRALDLSKHWHYEAVPPKISSAAALTGAYTVYENGFIDCATPAATSSIRWYASGATAGVTYSNYIFHWVIDFVSRH